MVWLSLVLAGLLEVVWSLGLVYTRGFTRLVPSVVTVAALAGSMVLLSRTARTLPIGVAYSIWVGIGVVGAAVGGHLLFGEAMPPARIFFLGILVVALVGLATTTSA